MVRHILFTRLRGTFSDDTGKTEMLRLFAHAFEVAHTHAEPFLRLMDKAGGWKKELVDLIAAELKVRASDGANPCSSLVLALFRCTEDQLTLIEALRLVLNKAPRASILVGELLRKPGLAFHAVSSLPLFNLTDCDVETACRLIYNSPALISHPQFRESDNSEILKCYNEWVSVLRIFINPVLSTKYLRPSDEGLRVYADLPYDMQRLILKKAWGVPQWPGESA